MIYLCVLGVLFVALFHDPNSAAFWADMAFAAVLALLTIAVEIRIAGKWHR